MELPKIYKMMAKARIDAVPSGVPDEKTKADVASYLESEATNGLSKIREDFPSQNRDIIYLDNAATSQKPAAVLDAEKQFYEKYNANPFRGLYELSEEATECYEEARKMVADFLHASCPEEIIFTRNATESLNLAAYTLRVPVKTG